MGRTGKETVINRRLDWLEGKWISGKGLNISKKLNPKVVKKNQDQIQVYHIIP